MRSVLHFDFQISDGSASAALNGPDYVEIPSQTMLSKGAFNIRGMGLIYIIIYIYVYLFIPNILSRYHIISYHTYHYLSQITKNINPSSRAAPQSSESPLDGSGSRRLEKSWSVSCLVMCMKQHVVKSLLFFPLGNKSKHETTHPRFTRQSKLLCTYFLPLTQLLWS